MIPTGSEFGLAEWINISLLHSDFCSNNSGRNINIAIYVQLPSTFEVRIYLELIIDSEKERKPQFDLQTLLSNVIYFLG